MVIYQLTGQPVKPSYATENMRLAPTLKKARELDIATNPAPEAIYEAGSGGFQIWCTPEDNPGGDWQQVSMIAAAFAKPCEYIASVHWKWGEGDDDETIIGLSLSTTAYALDPDRRRPGEISNRPSDIAWAKKKIHKLFKLAGVPMPPIYVERD